MRPAECYSDAMNGIGPIYCETPGVDIVTSFPLELVNTLTSAVPLLLGLWALWWLYTHKQSSYVAYALAILAACTGLGSILWHGLRTPLMLTLDVVPGLLYFVTVLYFWPYFLRGRWAGYVFVVMLFGAVYAATLLIPRLETNGPPPTLFAVTILFSLLLLYWTRLQSVPAFYWGAVMIGCATAAAIFRTIDLATCTVVPFGTHFMWHILLGVAAYCGVRMMAILSSTRVNK